MLWTNLHVRQVILISAITQILVLDTIFRGIKANWWLVAEGPDVILSNE